MLAQSELVGVDVGLVRASFTKCVPGCISNVITVKSFGTAIVNKPAISQKISCFMNILFTKYVMQSGKTYSVMVKFVVCLLGVCLFALYFWFLFCFVYIFSPSN